MELEIQKYLRSGQSIQELIWDFDLQTYESSNYPELISFDYSIISPKEEKIVQEARGLVLNKDSWEVECLSMKAFDNEKFDEKAISCGFEKYDGCLIVLYFYNDDWLTATRFSVDGDCYVASAFSNEVQSKWYELFWQTLKKMNIDKNKFISKLDKDCCYSFELCTKFNRNVVIYDHNFLKLLSITNKVINREENILKSDLLYLFPDLEPKFWILDSIDEYHAIINKNIPGYEFEGIILLDKNFNRKKLRNPNFNSIAELDETKNLEIIQRLILGITDTGGGGG